MRKPPFFIGCVVQRGAFVISMLGIVFFNGNYLNVQKLFVLTKHPKKWVRWIGMAIIDFVMIMLWVIITDLLVAVLIH